MNIFKRIWNFIRPEKKKQRTVIFDGKEVPVYEMPERKEPIKFDDLPEVRNGKIKLSKPHTQLFRNQQLPGKIYNIGKSRFRIKKKLGMTHPEKLRYEITQL